MPILQSRGNPFALHNFRSLLHHAACAPSTDGHDGLEGLGLWPVVNGRTRLSEEETESCASSHAVAAVAPGQSMKFHWIH